MNRPKVLIVDNDELVLRSVARLIRGTGFEVIEATSAGAALAESGPFLCAICDIDLGSSSSGLHLAANLRLAGRTESIVFFSGTADVQTQERARRLGTFVNKARGASELVGVVRSCPLQSSAQSTSP